MKSMRGIFLLGLCLVSLAAASFSGPDSASLAPIQESEAYKKFSRRPQSDMSKLIYLIDRFEPSGAVVEYDGFSFNAPIAALAARTFLARNYKNESVEQWIQKWCTTSIGGQRIFARFPDGSYKQSRDILLEESEALDEVLEAKPQQKPGKDLTSPTSS
jgi:hypothetical protein